MTKQQIEKHASRDAVKYQLALAIREMLDAAKTEYGAQDWADDYVCEIQSDAGTRADEGIGGPCPRRERHIVAASPAAAAAKAVRQWRGERCFFSNECVSPAILVDGTEYVPSSYASGEDNVYLD